MDPGVSTWVFRVSRNYQSDGGKILQNQYVYHVEVGYLRSCIGGLSPIWSRKYRQILENLNKNYCMNNKCHKHIF